MPDPHLQRQPLPGIRTAASRRPPARSLHDALPRSIQSGTGRDSAPSGKPLTRANTDLYYANGVEEELLEIDRAASPSPRQSVLLGAGGSAANGWADGGGAAAARPPRPKSSPRMPAPMLGPPSGRAGETDAAFTDGTPPGLRGRMNEVSESEAAALCGSGQRPAHLYAGPANRSNTAAAEYLRNQVGGWGAAASARWRSCAGWLVAVARFRGDGHLQVVPCPEAVASCTWWSPWPLPRGCMLVARWLRRACEPLPVMPRIPRASARVQGFTFPTMLAAGASPGQAQLLQAAPRVRARGGCVHFAAAVELTACLVHCCPAELCPAWLLAATCADQRGNNHPPHSPIFPCSTCRLCRSTDGPGQ